VAIPWTGSIAGVGSFLNEMRLLALEFGSFSGAMTHGRWGIKGCGIVCLAKSFATLDGFLLTVWLCIFC
jgi:hypothetical protein